MPKVINLTIPPEIQIDWKKGNEEIAKILGWKSRIVKKYRETLGIPPLIRGRPKGSKNIVPPTP